MTVGETNENHLQVFEWMNQIKLLAYNPPKKVHF